MDHLKNLPSLIRPILCGRPATLLRQCRAVLAGLVTLAAASLSCAGEPSPLRWEPTYKIKPAETHRLTEADVVGPDGIVYPDWRYAGVPGGIPELPEIAAIEQFGGKADDDQDDAPALQRGAAEVARHGGGALVLGKGTYHLDRPVIITHDRVVIRGQGAEATEIEFRYGVAAGTVRFFCPREGETVGPDSWIEIHAAPDGLKRIAVEVDDQTVAENVRRAHWGGTYLLRCTGREVVRRAGPGPARLKAVAQWEDGSRAEALLPVTVDPDAGRTVGRRRVPIEGKGSAAIRFVGDYRSGASWKLARDGRRGSREIELAQRPTLKPGDAVVLEAPATERWNKLVENACLWGIYRRYEFRVEASTGSRVRLNQPLRYDFPAVDGSFLKQVYPIRRCGVESLTIRQTEKLWTSGVLFSGAWECWARGVRVIKTGRFPVYCRYAKWCEIRDCLFEDAWYLGGGGTAYVGWERCCDCLMENVTTHRLRHAPCVQWSASGNVIRQSAFHGSDAQWHSGWTNENLFEQCFVDATGRWGCYGHGGWASPPEDKAHGPEGPRNVIYNCDFRAKKTGLWMGGMNEAWLILHNRFLVGGGPGIYARRWSFDHLIHGNVIALARPDQPAVRLDGNDCIGVELVGNRVYGGNGQLLAGAAKPLLVEKNTLHPYSDNPPRPTPEVPSIFRWQREH